MKYSFRVLIFAATETTSSALARILYKLSHRPDVQDKLREELKGAFEDNEELTHDQLVSLPYLDAVCRETLRVYVNFPRILDIFSIVTQISAGRGSNENVRGFLNR